VGGGGGGGGGGEAAASQKLGQFARPARLGIMYFFMILMLISKRDD
jgi:hypothetical protein